MITPGSPPEALLSAGDSHGTLAEIVFGTHQTKRSGSVGICGGALALMICQ